MRSGHFRKIGWIEAATSSARPGRARPLVPALEQHAPNAVEALEGSFELVPGEFPGEGLEADRGTDRAVCQNSSVDVRRVDLESCLAEHGLAFDAQRDGRGLASTAGRCRRAGPFAVIGTTGATVLRLRREQQARRYRDMKKAFHWAVAAMKKSPRAQLTD
jgi:hypothetical protein